MSETPDLRLKRGEAVPPPAPSWSADVSAGLRASRRLAWIVAAVAAAVAVVEAVALAVMAPLKTVVPYTLLVDRQTGYVETVDTLRPGAVNQDRAVTESFLVRYVLARESYDVTDVAETFGRVTLWSAGGARTEYEREFDRASPTARQNLYPSGTTLAVTVKSVELLSATTALVRFDTVRRDPGAGGTGEQRSYVAAIAFRYTGAPARAEDRYLNPLGFQVTRYRRDAETPAGAVVRVPAPIVAPVVAAPTVVAAPVIGQPVVAAPVVAVPTPAPAPAPSNVTVNVAPAPAVTQ